MNDNRLNPRFNCDETATLIFGDNRLQVSIVDVSYGGMGIEINSEKWLPFDFAMEVKGEVEINSSKTCFNARICWTSSEDDMTKTGLQTIDMPKDIWRGWVDHLKGIQPPERPMFDVG